LFGFKTVLAEILPYFTDSNSRNSQQNISARLNLTLKLEIELCYIAHGVDAIHLEAASGLSKATALKYVHQVAELICTHLTKKLMGETLLKDDGYMEGCRERFCLRNGFPLVGAAIDGICAQRGIVRSLSM
jgi:hypothetical protein